MPYVNACFQGSWQSQLTEARHDPTGQPLPCVNRPLMHRPMLICKAYTAMLICQAYNTHGCASVGEVHCYQQPQAIPAASSLCKHITHTADTLQAATVACGRKTKSLNLGNMSSDAELHSNGRVHTQQLPRGQQLLLLPGMLHAHTSASNRQSPPRHT